MAKFFGKIGFTNTAETTPGVWSDDIIEREYCGDINRNTHRFQSLGNLNDDINISNEISVIADPFGTDNLHLMKYVEFMGVKWKITNVEVQRPRLILTVGGVYNENET